LLAMDVNDDANGLSARGAWRFFASKPAPEDVCVRKWSCEQFNIVVTWGNTSISRISNMHLFHFMNAWYTVYFSGMYHSTKS